MPTYGNGTKLRVKAGNAADTYNGAGARKIYIQGIEDITGNLISEILETNGASAGSNSTYTYLRLFRAYVYESGSYATTASGSHVGDIVIENAAGNSNWLTIDSANYAKGQSEVACYTVPTGYEAYIGRVLVSVDSNKAADVFLYTRTGVLDTGAPYQSLRAQTTYAGVLGVLNSGALISPYGPYEAGTDIGFMAKTSTSANVSVDFLLALVLSNN